MKQLLFFLLMMFFSFIFNAQVDTILWRIDNLSEIGGNAIQIIGEPKIIETEIGFAIEFDGIDDGIIVANNPMAGATAYTVEIIFKPYIGGGVEQRFLHFQQDNDNRILIELRNNEDRNWSLDTFIKSGSSSQALLDYSFVHPLNEWAHAALVFKDGMMEHYVNGEKELEGTVEYKIVDFGQTSLGVRLNQVSWFKGAIHSVKITHDALRPDDFMDIELLSNTKKVANPQISSQVFPNPIVPSSQLKYVLTSSAKVSIKILDIEGKEVARLFEGFKSTGSHELMIGQRELSAGVYFVVINSANKRAIQKIIIEN